MSDLKITHLAVKELKANEYNPKKFSESMMASLEESIIRFGFVDPLIVNSAPKRKNILIGGHARLKVASKLGHKTVPVVFVNIPDLTKEKELNLRLHKNTGEWDLDLLAEFDENLLTDVGFSSEELDDIFLAEESPEEFDLDKELAKLDIKEISVKKGDVYEINGSRLMCGDSTIEKDVLALMNGAKVDSVITDPPYILDYLKGKKKKNGEPTTGFGLKRDRRYLETDVLPENFTQLWMANVNAVQKKDFSILVYENWKNLRTIWGEMEKYWKVRNMIVWHVPNRVQGFAAKNKFFNKHDIAMVATSDAKRVTNLESEPELLQNEYETALFAISGNPHWESYGKGNRYCPTDFIEHIAADEKSSGQGIIFGTKPLEVLIPYIKILTKRDDLVFEPFGGSGSTLIASIKLERRCYLMEKSPVYAEVIKRRWEQETGTEATLVASDSAYGKEGK